MSQFPLYTTLMTGLENKDITLIQKNEFLRKVTDMDLDAQEKVYALVKCYYLENENGDKLTIPYDGQLGKDRIDFDLEKMPKKLKRLLYKFANVHSKKIMEDEEIKKIQNIESIE